MYPIIPASFQQSLSLAGTALLEQVTVFLPKILAALVVLVLGAALSRWIKRLAVKGLELLRLSKGLKDTPVDSFLKHAEAGKIEDVVGSVIYWLFMLVVLHAVTSILGLESISSMLDRVLLYVPNVLAAIIVLFIGVLLSGVVESLVKGAIKSMDGKSARLLGKVSSYLVVIIAVMAAFSELQIAQQFISTLFIGLVAMFALALGLAFGLGSKDVIGKMMMTWYERMKKEMDE